jgi:hypothetical protein
VYNALAAANTLTVTSVMPQYSTSVSTYGLLSSTMATISSNFRVVSCGWKISCTQPIGINGGRTGWLFIAPLPTSPDFPSDEALSTTNILAAAAGNRLTERIPAGTIASSGLLELPGAIKVSLSEMGSQCIMLCDRPTSFHYADFYPTADAAGITATLTEATDIVYTTATGVVGNNTFAASVNLTAQPGHTSYALWFEGLPAAAQNLVDIEFIYHIEGTPLVTTTFAPVPVGPTIGTDSSSWMDILKTVGKVGMKVLDLATEYGPSAMELSRQYDTNVGGAGGYKLIGY